MSQTKREFLVSLGLAQAGARGRFSKEAQEAINKAEAEGTVFLDAPVRVSASSEPTREHNAKAVRRWAAKQGISLGNRGRIPAEVVNRYFEENDLPDSGVVAAAEAVAVEAAVREPVREETVAYGYARRGPDAPEYLAEPVVAIENCGRCGQGIAYCRCTSGPWVPTYLTNGDDEQASLTKPE